MYKKIENKNNKVLKITRYLTGTIIVILGLFLFMTSFLKISEPLITLQQFEKIAVGEEYSQIEEEIGTGETLQEVNVDNYTIKRVVWYKNGIAGPCIILTFKDNIVISKENIGL
ncbi:MAG: hypothetical protein Q4G05_03010 [Clostridia bacterium]|nr:hypothetical protein [Clostridia bacterium]